MSNRVRQTDDLIQTESVLQTRVYRKTSTQTMSCFPSDIHCRAGSGV